MMTLNTLLPSASDVAKRDPTNIHKLECIFAPQRANNYTKVAESKHQCAHFRYKHLLNWIHQEMAHNDSIGSIHAPLETFTMVRDPFDRIRSLFYYVRKFVNTSQWWKQSFSESQYEMVRSGDFSQWMKELAMNRSKNEVCALQFEYLNDNVDRAISMLGSSNITVFLNECFEASLRLMELKYALRPGAVDAFLHSNFNLNKGAYNGTPESVRLSELREQSKLYFPNEYKFYGAVAEQFKHQMSSSKVITPQLMEECLHKLPTVDLPLRQSLPAL
jgi:hypothetical protein